MDGPLQMRRLFGSVGGGGHKDAVRTKKELAMPNEGRVEPSSYGTYKQDPNKVDGWRVVGNAGGLRSSSGFS